ncbi:DUF4232 domain-containing protein [Cryptosporangium sp. NPDC048952]|uniref:DUF4232 domain-containing protein n=1 Tax=Cryptosporangium sp. NPDC048952 TaxID=3363961 RepID=UPI003720A426
MGARTVGALLGLGAILAVGACGGSGNDATPNVRPPGGVAPYTTEAEDEEAASSQPLEPVLTATPPALGSTKPPTPATQAPPPPPHNLGPCKTAGLDVRVIRQLGTSKNGPGVGLVALRNTGTKTCALSGWPSVGLTKAGTPVDVPATKVNKPRQPVGMALQPQRTAFAGLQWRGCPPTATGCRSGDGFRIGAPGSSVAPAQLTGFSTAEQKGFPVGSIVIGSLQPTTTDIINW